MKAFQDLWAYESSDQFGLCLFFYDVMLLKPFGRFPAQSKFSIATIDLRECTVLFENLNELLEEDTEEPISKFKLQFIVVGELPLETSQKSSETLL